MENGKNRIDYTRVAEFVNCCHYIIDNAEKIKTTTLADIFGIEDSGREEENLDTVWALHDLIYLKENGYITQDELNEKIHELNDNIKVLAKADLLKELSKEIKLSKKDKFVTFIPGSILEVNGVGNVLVLRHKAETSTIERIGFLLCKREDPNHPFIVWKYNQRVDIEGQVSEDYRFYSGEYFETEEEARSFFTHNCIL